MHDARVMQAAVPSAAAPRRIWRLDGLTSAGIVLAVILLFGVSGGMLWLFGYNYDGLSGGAATKIHPFTYLMVLLFAWRMVASGNPVGCCVHLINVRPASVLMIVTAMLLFVNTVMRQAPGMAGIIDTFIGPSLLMLLLADADQKAVARLETVLHGIMTVNALMALGEFATKTLVFPYRFDGVAFTDSRSTALQGHPLVNAAVTAFYVMALLNSGRPSSPALRLAMIGLQCAALVAFGGRSAMVVTLLLGGAYVVVLTLRTLRAGRVPLLHAAAAVMLLALLPIAIGGLAGGGFFSALLDRFVSDGGSANARAEMLELFRYISLGDLIVGPDVSVVDSLRRVHGLEWGIENPIVNMTLYQGAFMMLVTAVALALFLTELARSGRTGVWLPMLAFVILINTSESISSKTTMIAKFIVIVFCMYRSGATIAGRSDLTASALRGRALQASRDRIYASRHP